MINIEDDILLNMGLIVVKIIKRKISVSQLELKEQIEIICCFFFLVLCLLSKKAGILFQIGLFPLRHREKGFLVHVKNLDELIVA